MKYPDPYDEMSDEQFHDWANQMLAKRSRPPTRMIALRMPEALVDRAKRAAGSTGVPYQVLIKRLVESGLDHLERTGTDG